MKSVLILLFLTCGILAFSQPDTLSITLENVKYPYPVKYLALHIEQQDMRMAYMDIAPTGTPNEKTVLLFHGKNFGGYYWANVISKLSAAGFRVIVPDQIGFGKSSKPYIHYSFHQLASNNKKLLDTLEVSQVIIIGHSMGGMLATRFALLYPESVKDLLLENPIGLEDYRSFVPYVSTEEQYQIELKATAQSIKTYYQNSYFKNWKPAYDYLVNVAAGVTYSSDFPRYAKVAAMTYQMIYEQPVVHEFSQLKIPVTLIIGTQDRTVIGKDKIAKELQQHFGKYATLGKQIAAKIPGAKLIELNAGHVPHIEIPEEFIQALIKSLQ